MGLFGKMFEKKECSICGGEIGLFYREENKVKVRQFRVTREFAGESYHVFMDDTKGWFAVARNMDEDTNPDILEVSQVIGCNLNIERNQEELQYEDNQGNLQHMQSLILTVPC